MAPDKIAYRYIVIDSRTIRPDVLRCLIRLKKGTACPAAPNTNMKISPIMGFAGTEIPIYHCVHYTLDLIMRKVIKASLRCLHAGNTSWTKFQPPVLPTQLEVSVSCRADDGINIF
eukprot:4602521-Pyramimonas_sp.AAC.1